MRWILIKELYCLLLHDFSIWTYNTIIDVYDYDEITWVGLRLDDDVKLLDVIMNMLP